MQKKFLNLFFFVVSAYITTECIAQFEPLFETEFFDDLANCDESLLTRQPMEDCLPDQQIIDDLITIGIPAALESNLYCVTFPPNVRDVIRLPSTQIYFDRSCNTAVGFNFFYNQTLKVYFTAHSPFLRSYLNIDEPDYIEEIDISFLTNVDIPEVFQLFTDIKLQERRMGFMLGFHQKYKGFAFSIIAPFYWLEHNFFLTNDEIDKIKNAPIFAGAGAGNSENDVRAFFLKHLVATKFGIGDLTFVVEGVAAQSPCSELSIGCRFIAPTAAAIDGCRSELWFGDILLFGGRFCKKAPVPPFDFAQLFRLALCCPPEEEAICKQQAIDLATNFLVGALDRLTANVADRSLGQQHFSFGPLATYTYDFSNRTGILAKGIIEYFFPRCETRFFLVEVNPLEFVRNYTDPAQAAANLQFLNAQAVNTLYPRPADVRVHPGVSVEFSLAATYNSEHVHAELGYDLWFQGKEHINHNACTKKLDIRRGTKPWAYQSKLFAKVFGDCNDWHVGLEGDVTVDSRGIGKDMTIGLDYTWDF